MNTTQIRKAGVIYCDRCDRPIEKPEDGYHKNTFNFHKVCPMPQPDNITKAAQEAAKTSIRDEISKIVKEYTGHTRQDFISALTKIADEQANE